MDAVTLHACVAELELGGAAEPFASVVRVSECEGVEDVPIL